MAVVKWCMVLVLGWVILLVGTGYITNWWVDYNRTKETTFYEVFIKDSATLKDVIDIVNGYHDRNIIYAGTSWFDHCAGNKNYEIRPLRAEKKLFGGYTVYKHCPKKEELTMTEQIDIMGEAIKEVFGNKGYIND